MYNNQMKLKLVFIFLFITLCVQAQVSPVNKDRNRSMQNAGGKAEFKRICRQEMKYPPEALKENIKGKVVLKFKVKKDGSLDHMKIKRSVDPTIDAEAIRLVRMLQWMPAIYRGSTSDAFAEYVIHFTPKKYKKIVGERGYDLIILPPEADTSLIVYDIPDKPAEFIDGAQKLEEFISKKLIYPPDAIKKNISGEVLVSFIVEPSGLITNLQVEKPLREGCSEEALRIAKQTRWKPAVYQDKLVRSRMAFPVRFQLSRQ